MAKKGMTERMKKFCELIVFKQLPIIQAYIEAGYSDKGEKTTIYKNAYTLYKQENIQAYIKELSELALEKSEAVFLKLLLFYQDLLADDSVSTKDKLKAAEQLSKIYGLISQNINVGTQDEMSIQFNISTNKQEE